MSDLITGLDTFLRLSEIVILVCSVKFAFEEWNRFSKKLEKSNEIFGREIRDYLEMTLLRISDIGDYSPVNRLRKSILAVYQDRSVYVVRKDAEHSFWVKGNDVGTVIDVILDQSITNFNEDLIDLIVKTPEGDIKIWKASEVKTVRS
jgi:hypothetical protein